MIVTIKKQNENTVVRLRRLGYALYENKRGKRSFVRRIHGREFPRFHLYVDNEDGVFFHCSLHLDQSSTVHNASSHAHNADHDSKEVQQEAERLKK